MSTAQGTQVTVTVPDGAPPGTLLSVPVKGNTDKIKVRVPEGCGTGSTLILVQQEGSEEWSLQVGKLVPYEEDAEPEGDTKEDGQQPAQAEGELDEVNNSEIPKVESSQQKQPPEEAAAAEQNPEPFRRHVSPCENGTQATAMPEKPQAYMPVQPLPLPSPERAWDGAVAYTVRLQTTVGAIDIIVRPDWAPNGTRRFLDLAASGDLEDLAFYRSIKGCIVQFGLPAKRHWPPIPDDPPTGVPFLLGAVSFAAVGGNTRRSTLFICIGDMSHCLGEKSWETPIGAVAESSLEVLERIETCYGDIAEFGGRGPDTGRINEEGNAYLRSQFPKLTYIRSATALDWEGGHGKMQKRQFSSATIEGPGSPEVSDSPARVTPRGRSAAAASTSRTAAAQTASKEAQARALEAAKNAQLAAEAEDPEEALRAALCARQAADAAQAAAEAAEAAQAALGGQRSSSFAPSPARRPGSAVRVPVAVQSRARSSSAVRAASTSADLRWAQRSAGYRQQELQQAWSRLNGGGTQCCVAGSAALPPGAGLGLQDTVAGGSVASAWPMRPPIPAQPLRNPAWLPSQQQSSARPMAPLQPTIPAQGLVPGRAMSPWPQPAMAGPRW